MGPEIVKYVITFIVGTALTAVFAFMKTLNNKIKAISKGMQDLLRGEIIHYYDRYMELGYCPIHIKQVVEAQYNSYHALKGNGVITQVWEELNALPTNPKHIKNDDDDLK
jgi:hypothetical protein